MKAIKIICFLLLFLSFENSFSQDFGYVNEQNIFVIQPKFFEARDFKEGLAAVRFKNDKGWTRWYFINETGEFAFKGKFWSVGDFNDGYATVEFSLGVWGVIDSSGEIIVSPFLTDLMSPVKEGMVRFKKGKFGFYNTKGKKVVKAQYDFADTFSNGMAMVKMGSSCGFINQLGELIVPIKYKTATNFVNNKAKVSTETDFYEIDLSGKETKISKLDFDKISAIENDIPKQSKKSYLKPSQKGLSNSTVNTQSNNNNIAVTSYALDLFSELGSMVIYKGATMYVVKVKGKKMQDEAAVSARANQVLGFNSAFKYQWFPGNNCTTLKSKYGGNFTVICQGEVDLDK